MHYVSLIGVHSKTEIIVARKNGSSELLMQLPRFTMLSAFVSLEQVAAVSKSRSGIAIPTSAWKCHGSQRVTKAGEKMEYHFFSASVDENRLTNAYLHHDDYETWILSMRGATKHLNRMEQLFLRKFGISPLQ